MAFYIEKMIFHNRAPFKHLELNFKDKDSLVPSNTFFIWIKRVLAMYSIKDKAERLSFLSAFICMHLVVWNISIYLFRMIFD